VAAPRLAAPASDCKAARAAAAKSTKKLYACNAPATIQQLGLTQNDLKSNAPTIVPWPSWCKTDGNWWFLRTDTCLIVPGVVMVWNGPTLVGELFYAAVFYSYTGTNLPNWAYQVTIAEARTSWGVVAGSSVEGAVRCDANCTVTGDNFPLQPVAVGTADNGTSFYTTTATSPGQVGWTNATWFWLFFNPAWAGPSTIGQMTAPAVRCDNALPNVFSVGCVFDQYVPAVVYPLAGPYPTLARHIQAAQNSGLPGAYPNGFPLSRLVNPVLQQLNRDTACPPKYPRNGLSCDEYPFASSNQGAATGGGGPRTWPWCGINLGQPNSTGSTGYSVCMIDPFDNSVGGSALGQMFNNNRVLSNDPFRVWVY